MLGSGDFEGACAAWVGEGTRAAGRAAVGWVLGIGVAGVEGVAVGWEGRNGDAFEGAWFGFDGRWLLGLLGLLGGETAGLLRGPEGELFGVNGLAFVAAGFGFGLGVDGLEVGVAVVSATTALPAYFRQGDRDVFDIVGSVGNCLAGCFRELVRGIVDSLLA